MSLDEELKAAIEKNLPSMLSKQLQERLAAGDEAIEKMERMEASLEHSRDQIRELERQRSDLTRKLNEHAALDERERELDERERNLKITLLEAKLACEVRFGEKVTDAMLGLVRNTEYRRSMFGSESVMAPSGYTTTMPKNEVTTDSAS